MQEQKMSWTWTGRQVSQGFMLLGSDGLDRAGHYYCTPQYSKNTLAKFGHSQTQCRTRPQGQHTFIKWGIDLGWMSDIPEMSVALRKGWDRYIGNITASIWQGLVTASIWLAGIRGSPKSWSGMCDHFVWLVRRHSVIFQWFLFLYGHTRLYTCGLI